MMHPQSYRLGFPNKALAHGVSIRVMDVREEDSTEVHTCTNEHEDEIGAHPDLDESFLGVLICMTKVVQHSEKVEKRFSSVMIPLTLPGTAHDGLNSAVRI